MFLSAASAFTARYLHLIQYLPLTVSVLQTWHSLGQGSSSFGTPVALSAGDSTPTWEKPRLNSIWYSNVTVGAGAVPGAAFKLPLICIPIPGTKLLLELGLRNISSLFTAFSNQRIRMRVEELLRDPMLLK